MTKRVEHNFKCTTWVCSLPDIEPECFSIANAEGKPIVFVGYLAEAADNDTPEFYEFDGVSIPLVNVCSTFANASATTDFHPLTNRADGYFIDTSLPEFEVSPTGTVKQVGAFNHILPDGWVYRVGVGEEPVRIGEIIKDDGSVIWITPEPAYWNYADEDCDCYDPISIEREESQHDGVPYVKKNCYVYMPPDNRKVLMWSFSTLTGATVSAAGYAELAKHPKLVSLKWQVTRELENMIAHTNFVTPNIYGFNASGYVEVSSNPCESGEA